MKGPTTSTIRAGIAKSTIAVILQARRRPMTGAETMVSDRNSKQPSEPPASPHYHGHRERLRDRFLEGGSGALADYELLELILFRALPRRDVKPLAKDLLARFGSFAEVISAPPQRLAEVKGLGEAAIAELKIVQAAAQRLARGEVQTGLSCPHGRACSTIAAPPWRSPIASSSACCSSTSATASSPTGSNSKARLTKPRPIRTRWSSARWSLLPPQSSWCTKSLLAILLACPDVRF
jgi:hypothetical protein